MHTFRQTAHSLNPPENCELLRPDLPGGDISYYPDIGLTHHSNLFEQLQSETPWEQKNITLFGKTHPQPRLVAGVDVGLNARVVKKKRRVEGERLC